MTPEKRERKLTVQEWCCHLPRQVKSASGFQLEQTDLTTGMTACHSITHGISLSRAGRGHHAGPGRNTHSL